MTIITRLVDASGVQSETIRKHTLMFYSMLENLGAKA